MTSKRVMWSKEVKEVYNTAGRYDMYVLYCMPCNAMGSRGHGDE